MKTILDYLVQYYGEDTSRRAMDNDGHCQYLTEDDKKCAFAIQMDDETVELLHKKFEGSSVESIIKRIGERTQEQRDIIKGKLIYNPNFYFMIQRLHDQPENWLPIKGLTERGIEYYKYVALCIGEGLFDI
jgi:hypothetical protein